MSAPLIIPEIIIQNTVEGILQLIPKDLEDNVADPTKSILYKLWNGTSLGNYNMFDQAKAVFVKNSDDPRKLKVGGSFDSEKRRIPAIYINLPSDQGGFNDGLGISPNRDSDLSGDDSTYIDNYSRGFTATYSIVITSDSKQETIIIYNTLRALMIPLLEHFDLECLENLKLSGRDLQIYKENLPKNLFIRAINLQTSYTVTVDNIITKQIAKSIVFNGSIYES